MGTTSDRAAEFDDRVGHTRAKLEEATTSEAASVVLALCSTLSDDIHADGQAVREQAALAAGRHGEWLQAVNDLRREASDRRNVLRLEEGWTLDDRLNWYPPAG